MSKKILSIFVLVLTLAFTNQASASLTFTTNAITGTTDSSIDLGSGNDLNLQTTGRNISIGTSTTLGSKLSIDASGSDTTPLIIKTNGSVGNYTPANSAIFIKDAAGTEILRIFASDPDALSNYNSDNLYIGREAGFSQPTDNTSAGYWNTGMGSKTLYSNTIGLYNTAIGAVALPFNTTGNQNVANGAQTLYSNTTGNNNTANGFSSLFYNTTGSENTAIGFGSLSNNIVGSKNVALGYNSGGFTTGSGNVQLGYSAGKYETGSDSFYVNNISQGNTANDKAYSLLYGTFSGTAGSLTGQKLTVNALLNVNIAKLSVYANNAAAVAGGLVAGDLYRTGGDPDPIMVVH